MERLLDGLGSSLELALSVVSLKEGLPTSEQGMIIWISQLT